MKIADPNRTYDAIIIGSGVSGSIMAHDLIQKGWDCLLLEAGEFFSRSNFPDREIDANSKLYWSGGAEFNHAADIAFLRPKVVGGGSIVNQALLDRFDEIALHDFKVGSSVDFFEPETMSPWYEKAEQGINQEVIPESARNKNAHIFEKGFEANGYKCAPLTRAQNNCRYEKGNDCIECLGGCRADSKQSMLITYIKEALNKGLTLKSHFEVQKIEHRSDLVRVHGLSYKTKKQSFKAKRLVLASGAIGNSKLLLNSGFGKRLPALGQNFYTHPQYMVLGLFKDEINSHRGPFQSLKSADEGFRRQGFKLENVYGPPVALSMLFKGFGLAHMQMMKKISHLACIEVAVRDTCPGTITVNRSGKVRVEKRLNDEDKSRRGAGLSAIKNIFESQGVEKIIEGNLPIGLHLMGGLGIGHDQKRSVVNPEFSLHGYKNIHVADSSIFPNAPGINPSLTIMALSKMAAAGMVK